MTDDLEDGKFGRRAVLEWAAASAALAGCARAPVRKIVPYVVQPPEVQPGRPLHYATAWEIDGYGMGLVVRSNEGRPTKIEGNPKHPSSLGATRAVDQALVEMLWDPDRENHLRDGGGPAAIAEFQQRLGKKRVAILMEPTSSRSVEGLVARVRRELPGSGVWFHTALSRANVWSAGRLATGAVVEPVLDFSGARVLVAFASDFLASGHDCVRNARGLADRRATKDGARLYSVESRRTATGAFADERFAATARARGQIACAIAAEILGKSASSSVRGLADRLRARAAGVGGAWAAACARDLEEAPRGTAAWIVGDDEPAGLHALAWLVNGALGSVGTLVRPVPSSVLEAGEASHDLDAFASSLARGDVDVAVVCGTNPLYSAPNGALAAALPRAKETVYVGLRRNETSRACRWFVPVAHPLESWGDVRADDGTASIVQPLIEPIFGGLTVAEILATLLGDRSPSGRELAQRALGLGDDAWNQALQSGVVAGTTVAPHAPALNEDALVPAVDAWELPPDRGLEVELHPSHAVLDGRFVTPLLLELPHPLSKLTWGNAAVVAHAMAARLSLEDGDVVTVTAGDRTIALPVIVDAGQADSVVSIALGWGRDGAERLARGVGQNAFLLESAVDAGAHLAITAAGRSEMIARTQIDEGLHAREHEIARSRLRSERPIPPDTRMRMSLYDPQHSPTAPNAWAMTIDMSRCTGCQACVVACQVENNVPTVGKRGVWNGRHMHWLRIDHYASERGAVFQPMLCQHCDDAPCEYVCPVNATVHSDDGLNEMIYNRCVGTRFCSNNCPYKVRRFNWFNYHEDEPAIASSSTTPTSPYARAA